MPPRMGWLATVVRLAIAPVLVGALALLLVPQRSERDLAAAFGLVLLAATHVLYWWSPWPTRPRRAMTAAAAMVVTNGVLLYLLGLDQPSVWLYPALVVGAGLSPPTGALGVGLLALAAVAPLDLAAARAVQAIGPSHSLLSGWSPSTALGPRHLSLLSVVLAGLGMTAVRQLVARTAELHATRAELAELAVASERERLAREVHDLLGRTLSLIAVKAELAGRLSAGGDPSASSEMGDVQRLARQAVREVRDVVAGGHAPSVRAELAAAESALRVAGIGVSVAGDAARVDPAHDAATAWVLREAVTNVVKHSHARTCRISMRATDGTTELEVVDDGRGPVSGTVGMGLAGLADRVHALGGTFEAGRGEAGGFRLRAHLGAGAPTPPAVEVAR